VAAELRRIHPSGLLQVSPEVESRCNRYGWTLEHLGATIGTVIHNVDLRREQTPDEIETMYALLLERKVICFRNQELTEEDQLAFGLRFGPLEIFPWSVRTGPRVDGVPGKSHPGILPQISRGKLASGASGFHSDVTWRKSPSLGSMLYCDEAPPFGGGTAFADTCKPHALQFKS
jgi:taurine dioxygenase